MAEDYLIMNDIHMHVIPGVDDGSWNQEMSMMMVYMAYKQGIRKIIATPHSFAFDEDRDLVKENYLSLGDEIQKFYPEMKVYLGCEIYCGKYDMKQILKFLKEGVYPSLNGTKYVLVEFHSLTEIEEIVFCTLQLLENGWIPVIAHVERYKNLSLENIARLKASGCMLQINAYSVDDETDWNIKVKARDLMAQKLVDFLGTDAHRTIHRPPSAEQGLKYLYHHFEKEYVDDITYRNAEKYLLAK